ncbi:MAG: sugar ABC transporter substrate-binding protein ChvE [Termitinemataceae bacterium]|nr:MAG: sugar ABC transporter substrate-binding protein ChvE [Termitinemataceae bacterium]
MFAQKNNLFVIIPATLLCLALFFCCKKQKNEDQNEYSQSLKIVVGVSMPSTIMQRWQKDGASIKSQLETSGYAVDLQYAGENDVSLQINQIKTMISDKVNVLVITAIDGNSLTDVLKEAKSNNIPVIAYDRLIMSTDALSYYATFDNNKIGQLHGQFIADKLGLEVLKGPFYLEAITGPSNDNNTKFLFGGALSVLQPYIDRGTLVVNSKQLTISDCGIDKWLTGTARARMERLIQNNNYRPGGSKLDAVLCSNDTLALGAIEALKAAGWSPSSGFPVITGQDCDRETIRNLIEGYQGMSVFKDTRMLAAKTARMVDALIKGVTPEINDTITFYNGVSVVPAYLCEPLLITAENYREILIGSNYYKESDF